MWSYPRRCPSPGHEPAGREAALGELGGLPRSRPEVPAGHARLGHPEVAGVGTLGLIFPGKVCGRGGNSERQGA
jgi:hypothetical protein